MRIQGILTLLTNSALVLTALAAAGIVCAQPALNLTTGWNLMGNTSSVTINVALAFGDPGKIATVWKWNQKASRWALYAPSMTTEALAAYTQNNGYDVLISVDPKEGFWVNALAPLAVSGTAAERVTLSGSELQQGWNLVATAGNLTPSQLNQLLSNKLIAAGKALVTIWAWDAPRSKWRFHAPQLEVEGGTVLADYIGSSGYLPFTGALSDADGFWLNVGPMTPTPVIATRAIQKNSIGIAMQNLSDDEMALFAENDLLGIAKMGGIWVSALDYDQFLNKASRFCGFAKSRNQKTIIQLPIRLKNRIDDVLARLANMDCNLVGVSIDNETSRLTVELPDLYSTYTVKDYIADVRYIAPRIRLHLPGVFIIALDLISFTPVEGADPIAEWLSPFCATIGPSSLVDYISIHYYAYNGAQKEWKNLELGKRIKGYFSSPNAKVPASCPPIVLGEFNATFNFSADTTYPGSGGESFMASLAVPEIFSIPQVEAMVHWSLIESTPSTLGLYDRTKQGFKPFFATYQLMKSLAGANRIGSQHSIPDLAITSFEKNGEITALVGNYSPFFKRGVSFILSSNSVTAQQLGAGSNVSIDLAPFSLTKIISKAGQTPVITGRFAYADRTMHMGNFSAEERAKPYCSPLANFNEPTPTGKYFVGADFNQNNKIFSGGTPSTIGTGKSLRAAGHIEIDCGSPLVGTTQTCGIKFPFTADNEEQNWRDWSEAVHSGWIRMAMTVDQPTEFSFSLRSTDGSLVKWDLHTQTHSINGPSLIDLPITQFRQAGLGVELPLKEALRTINSLTVETRNAPSRNYRISSVELCDRL